MDANKQTLDVAFVSVPTRGLLIPNGSDIELNTTEYIVSVPTRGLLISNKTCGLRGLRGTGVSVPTRGLLIPNPIANTKFEKPMYKFPSPQGVS